MTVKVSKPAINIREKLSELQKPSGIAGEALLRADTPQEAFEEIGAGRKNLLINGDFRVSQRGTYTTAVTATHNVLYLDRWTIRTAGSLTATLTHILPHAASHPYPNISNSVKLIATNTTSGMLRLLQRVEGRMTSRTLTFSSWVKSDNSNARIFCYRQGTGDRVASEPHSGNGSWEKLTVTYTDNASTANNLYFDIAIASEAFGNATITTGDYIEASEAQLELGKVATPFEHRSYGEELALCQRYFYKAPSSNGYMYSMLGVHATSGEIQYYPPATMRTAPSVSLHDASPYWEVFPWNTVGNNSIHITSIHSGHMSLDGHGQVGVFFSGTTGSYVTPNLVRGLNYAIRADFIAFSAEL